MPVLIRVLGERFSRGDGHGAWEAASRTVGLRRGDVFTYFENEARLGLAEAALALGREDALDHVRNARDRLLRTTALRRCARRPCTASPASGASSSQLGV